MISDESLEELHEAARALNMRYVAFGRDHYDIPDVLWDQACEIAELVDSRRIVRSLRASGLRVHGGKPKKTWRQIHGLPAEVAAGPVAEWLGHIRPFFDDGAIELLARPGEMVALHLLRHADRPDLGALADPNLDNTRLVHTVVDGRYSLELAVDLTE